MSIISSAYDLSAAEAAKLLGVTPQAIRDIAKRGELSYQTTEQGSRTLFWFQRADVEALKQKRTVGEIK